MDTRAGPLLNNIDFITFRMIVVLYVLAKSEISSMAEERMNTIKQYRKYM